MAFPDNQVDVEFFINSLPRECRSRGLREELLSAAVKKNGKQRDTCDENLLFPPSVIQRILISEKARAILDCECSVCASVTMRELLSDDSLVDAVTAKKGDEQRTLFALLVFMGAGFAVRHICSYNTRGWEIENHQQTIQAELFQPLENIFPNSVQVTRDFISIYKKMWLLFNSPTMQRANVITNYDGYNLPFIDRDLNADKGAFGSIYCFEIHPEFRSHDIPALAVRKELPRNTSAAEERRILEFLAKCGKRNFVELLFWYQYGDKVNYVFPKHPGSLYQVLEGQLDGQIFFSRPSKYRSLLQHWLWQGMVELTGALKFFHNPGHEQHMIPLDAIAAHFDLKPANVLVTKDGVLLLTDFGQARVKQPDPRKDIALRWTRAYDVWSMACIMTEVIEYILHGTAGFKKFQELRFGEDRLSAAFWKKDINGGYRLKSAVEVVLSKFEELQDCYLTTVTHLIRTMFSIEPLGRPPISECLAILSEDFPTDDWPLKEEDEVSIAGLGTIPQLRNMHTQYVRRLENPNVPRRCKMYLLLSTNSSRVRIVIEFEKEIVEGESRSKVNCILSDSAPRGEEEFKLLSLFDATHTPNIGLPFECSFRIAHHNLYFVFDEQQRAPDDYYYFFTAVTRQRSLRPQVHMPISKCTVRLATIKTEKKFYRDGHVQIWKELTEEEYMKQFTFNPAERRMSEANSLHPAASPRSPTQGSIFSPTLQSRRLMSFSTSSSGSASKPKSQVKTRRLAIFLAGVGQQGVPESDIARLLTINLTNRTSVVDLRRNGQGHTSPLHVTIRAGKGANFNIGNFPSQRDCPGIPLDPEMLAEREDFHVDWVDLEFKNEKAMKGFTNLWGVLYPDN